MPSFEEYTNEIKSLWDSRWLTNSGEKHRILEDSLKKYFNVPLVQLYANGHLALETALSSMDLTGEVITTPYTFSSTTQAILRSGLQPVFCDIDSETYCIDPDKIEGLITDKTCAILPVHVYGNICDHSAIQKIADKYGLKIIYDAAHAFGETIDGNSVAGLGDMSMFSFHATKVFHTVEGGCIVYSNPSYTERLTALKQFGMIGKEDAEYIGSNCKMSEFHAAMGICNLRHIAENIALRKKCVERYRKRLGLIKGIKLCPTQKNVESNYAYFPVLFDDEIFGGRDNVFNILNSNNIIARKYFYPQTSDFTAVRAAVKDIKDTPISKYVSEHVLCLPLYSELTIEEIDGICDIIESIGNS